MSPPPTPQVWAPDAARAPVETSSGTHDMEPGSREGWWTAAVSGLGHGHDYAFRIDGGPPRPDPRSRWQPHGVHGSSRLYDHEKFAWTDDDWRGVTLPGSTLY